MARNGGVVQSVLTQSQGTEMALQDEGTINPLATSGGAVFGFFARVEFLGGWWYTVRAHTLWLSKGNAGGVVRP